MSDSAVSQPTEANEAEKNIAAQANSAQHHHSMQPNHFQPSDVPKPDRFRPSKPFSVGKLSLATCNAIFAIIVIGLSAGILSASPYDLLLVGITGAMGIVSLIWQLAEFLTITIRHSLYRPIHPGAHIALHLILWVLALIVTVSGGFTLSYALSSYSINPQCSYSSAERHSYSNDILDCDWYTFNSEPQANLYLGLLEALTSFCALMLVSHFALFVLACIETDYRRKWNKPTTRVVYMLAGADGRTYYSQVPPQALEPQNPDRRDPERYGYFAPEQSAEAANHPAESRQTRTGTARLSLGSAV